MPKIIVTSDNITKILHLIDTCKGKLTWPLLSEQLKSMLGLEDVTRQTLSGYKDIQKAFTARKVFLRENTFEEVKTKDSDVEYLMTQIEGLEAELARAN